MTKGKFITFCIHYLRGIFERTPFYMYKPNPGELVYHQVVIPGTTSQDMEKLPQSVQPEDEEDQFYVIVDGNHRYDVWRELYCTIEYYLHLKKG